MMGRMGQLTLPWPNQVDLNEAELFAVNCWHLLHQVSIAKWENQTF